jgi:ribonuclease BN (tRNA processing enzyme)
MGATDQERSNVRDIILSHAHLDHIAGLPLFLDDLFATLSEPVRIHACDEVIEVLERDIFNWSVYPRFSELSNSNGSVLEYYPIRNGVKFAVEGLEVLPIAVNHKVPSSGFLISEGRTRVALTGDTSSMDEFWEQLSRVNDLDALLIECAFPDELADLAAMSHHLTPSTLSREMERFGRPECPTYVVNIKPSYRDQVVEQLKGLGLPKLEVLDIGRIYNF